MTFSGSYYIDFLSQFVEPTILQDKLNELAGILGISLSPEAIDFLLINPINIKLKSLNDSLSIIIPLSKSQTLLADLSKYFAAKELLEFSDPSYSVFNSDAHFPNDYAAIAEAGATGLFQYGYNQFKALKYSCDAIVKFILKNNYEKVWLIESPLGNVVPVQVLSGLSSRAGINPTILTISLPRNEKQESGFTIDDIVCSHIKLLENENGILIYLDDIITGTRFRKVANSIQKHINNTSIKFIPCALVFTNIITPDNAHKKINDSNKLLLKERLAEVQKQYSFDPWFQIPELPRIKIDRGHPVVYESPVVWGEQPIVAGMKKCNYVFNIIEQFRSLIDDLVSNINKSRDKLLWLWSRDTNGSHYIITDDVVLKLFEEIQNAIEWEDVKNCAKDDFSSDYSGLTNDLRPQEAYERMNWVTNQLSSRVKRKLGQERSNLLQRALSNLFAVQEKYFPEDRDYSYCNYYLKYNSKIARLNEKLVELILNIT